MKNIYTVEKKEIETKPGCWSHLECTVLKNGEAIGSYKRNYSSFFNTFCPFELNGKEFALYSPDYTVTRILSLPDCVDIGGEEPNSFGFCPTDFYVPKYMVYEDKFMMKDKECTTTITDNQCEEVDKSPGVKITVPVTYRDFGFVAGCIWGDDSSWKIEYLDLSEADKGIIKREAKFGYVALPDKLSLKEAIVMSNYEPEHPWIDVITQVPYNLKTGKTC